MSDEEFLARWSRRKREARAAVDAPPPTEPVEKPNPARPATVESPANAEVDISSLPSIDSIDAATDITAFLRNGIPQELSRAALRRAWTADPAIRDFIGLAENAWDFNDPNAMPGFGPLDCTLATGGDSSRSEPPTAPAAVQGEPSQSDCGGKAVVRRRTHGGALPR